MENVQEMSAKADIFATKIDNSDLSPAYQKAYKLAVGFLEGSSFAGNVDCQSALNGIVYYGFEVMQYRQAYNPKNTF